MHNKTYKIFCVDCKSKYQQKALYPPNCCGNCDSNWIAVKEVCMNCGSDLEGFFCKNCYSWNCEHAKNEKHQTACDQIEEIVQMEILRDLRT